MPRPPEREISRLRIVAALAASAFLAWQSVTVFLALFVVRPASWPTTALVAWLVNMLVTGVFALPTFVLPVQRLLPAGYYRIRRPARLRTVYRALGVGAFRTALLATLWRSRAKRRDYFDGSASGLERLAARSRAAEFGHLVPFGLLTAASFAWAADGGVHLALWTMGINTLGNLYPVVLQRHHRMRVQRLQSLQRDRPKRERARPSVV